jgi:hypothetical protein
MSPLVLILVVILVIVLLGGYTGGTYIRQVPYGYGFGNPGNIVVTILVIILIVYLLRMSGLF